MEIRCNECQHLGPAAEVLSGPEGVELVCANCGFHNKLAVSAPTSAPAPDPSTPTPASPRPASAPQQAEQAWLKREAFLKLAPEPGDGPRCRKCAHLLAPEEDFCPRCGLARSQGERYAFGNAPWDQAPEGREAVFEQATLLARVLRDNPTAENLYKFGDFARDEDLLEYGVRQLRFFIVENPDFPGSLELLEDLASRFHSRIIVAQARAQVSADEFGQLAVRLKRSVIIGLFLDQWILL